MNEALEFIKQCIPSGNNLLFPPIELDRPVYNEVKKLLEGVNGRWDKKIKGFVFKSAVEPYLERLLDGEKINLTKEFQFFETPTDVCDRLVNLAGIGADFNGTILEPSAGRGAIISAVHKIIPNTIVDVCELMPENREYLKTLSNISFVGDDFLKADLKKYDCIVANPPFAKNQDIKHVERMYSLLKPNGVLVAIVSTHWKTSTNKVETAFRKWVKEYAVELIELERNVFEKTSVPTIILKFVKSQKSVVDYDVKYSNGYVSIEVRSELYGTTTACGDADFALEHGWLPCGDGSDHKLTIKQINAVKRAHA